MTRFLPAVECIPKVASQRSFGILSPIFGGAEVQNDLRQEFSGTPATDPQPSEPGILEVSNVGGITVVTEDTKSPVATVAAIVGAGTRDEPVRAPGVARMLKQMAFKKS